MYSFRHKKTIMNLQEAEQFLQEKQSILENKRQQRQQRAQKAFFIIHILFAVLTSVVFIVNYQKTGEWNFLFLVLSLMSMIFIVKYLKSGYIYRR